MILLLLPFHQNQIINWIYSCYFDFDFLADFGSSSLAACPGDVIYFKLSDAASPALIGDSVDESAIFVLMPMRV